MHYRYFKAVASCALAIACASATNLANAAQWTSFSVGNLGPTGYGLSMARLPDGRFVLGAQGQLFVQNTWGSGDKTEILSNGITHDPSFVAIRSDTSGLLGAGGFTGPSGLYPFNPSTPGTPLVSTPIATLQNYSAAYWKHPSSGREGWIIGGANGADFNHNLTFVSADGAHTGPVTGVISTYSSGVCTDNAGNVYAALSEYGIAADDNNKVLKFTAAQVDAAVAAIIASTPAPVAKGDASVVHKFAGTATIAVDGAGRLWAAAYEGYLEVFDPANGFARQVKPDHGPLKSPDGKIISGKVTYQVQTFQHGGQDFVGYFASDYSGTPTIAMVQGYKPSSEILTRAVYFPQTSLTKTEADGTVNVTVTISPVPTKKVTVPLTVSGTAVKGKDYTMSVSSLTFEVNQISAIVPVKIIDNGVDAAVDAKTVVIRLGTAAPATEAYIPAEANTFTLTIMDDDHKAELAANQPFTTGRIGSNYSYQIAMASGVATSFSVSGLPPGMTFSSTKGLISGRPTVPGEYDEIWITATSAAGTTTSTGYYLKVDDFSPAAHGNFLGLVERTGAATGGLGARLDLSVTSTANFTGKITIGATSYPLSGLLDTSPSNPTGTASFVRNGVPHSVTFTIDATTGSLGGSVDAAKISGWKAQTATLLAGLHNFVAATPGGPGKSDPQGATYGSVAVQANGSASVSIHAADGTLFASSGALGPNGEALVYQSAYALPGSMLGTLTIAGDVLHTLGGSVGWTRPLQAMVGWANEISLTAKGGKYRPVSGSAIVMNLPSKMGPNGDMELQDGGVDPVIHVPFTATSPATVTIGTGNKLSFTNSSGAFTGSFKLGFVVVSFQGLIVPDLATLDLYDGTGVGYFLTPGPGSVVTRSGMVSLAAAP